MVSADYLAGFFDGEGTVLITSKRNAQGHRYHYVSMRIPNTYRPILEEIAEKWGGTIHTWLNSGSMGKRRPIHMLVWGSRVAVTPLTAMLPYLRQKRPQALIALEFAKLTGRKKGRVVMSQREWNYRNYLQWLLHEYNAASRAGLRSMTPAWGASSYGREED